MNDFNFKFIILHVEVYESQMANLSTIATIIHTYRKFMMRIEAKIANASVGRPLRFFDVIFLK